MFSATRFLLAATTILAKSVSISAKRDIGPDEANSTNDAHFILDSGANIHICNDASLFVRFYTHKNINKPYVTVASGEALPIQAIGDIQLSLLLPDGTKSIQIIKNVYYVPTSAVNVFSVRRLWKDNNAKVRFRDNAIVTFSDGVRLVLPAISSHYTLVVDSKTKKNIASEWNRPQVSYGSRSQTPIDDDVIHNAPTTADERADLAEMCVLRLNLKVPMLLDDMSDTVDGLYHALPERLYLLDADHRIHWRTVSGPRGFDPDAWAEQMRALVG